MREIIFLSLIQSITEFLPVSSSGHLILAQKIFDMPDSIWLTMMLHLGTLIAVISYFYKDIFQMAKAVFSFKKSPLFFKLCVATLPMLIMGFFCHSFIHSFHQPTIIAGMLIGFGILLWISDKYSSKEKSLSQLTYKEAFLIGLAQILALIPGTSRLGITITCARYLGFNRSDSAKFSMLLSIPVILAGAVYLLWQRGGLLLQETLPTSHILCILLLTSLLGWIFVWFLMTWVKKVSFAIFAIYRIILGLLIFYVFL